MYTLKTKHTHTRTSRSLNQLFPKCSTEVIGTSWDLAPPTTLFEIFSLFFFFFWCLSTFSGAGKSKCKQQLSRYSSLVHTGIGTSVLGYMTKTSFTKSCEAIMKQLGNAAAK